MPGPTSKGFSDQGLAGPERWIGSSLGRGDPLGKGVWATYTKYTVGDPLAPILGQDVTVDSRHVHFRFIAATLPISVTKAVKIFKFVTSSLTK